MINHGELDACHAQTRNEHRILAGNLGRELSLWGHRHGWNANIKTDLKTIKLNNLEWTELT